jgi:glutamate/tyrosine decarboxylase-like PLP-dependent enzyme
MLGIKKGIYKATNPFSKSAVKFPDNAVSPLKLKSALFWLTKRLQSQRENLGLSDLAPRVDKTQVKLWQALLPYNPNNLGNWSTKKASPAHETALFEREVIAQMADLYQAKKKNLEGYITSGATEANIFCAWLGREYLVKAQIPRDKICLLQTSLTHYSVAKAARLIGVDVNILPLNLDTWGMDADSLPAKIAALKKKGYQGFLLPLTLGYTLTGTTDPYDQVCRVIKKLKKKQKIEIFVWIDAAFNGLIEPFLNQKFSPFSFTEIQAMAVDFHKFGIIPIPAGLVLYRGKLRTLIEKPIDYLKQKDNTLLGTRSGIAAVGCWLMIHSLGKKGLRKIVLQRQAQMQLFVKKNESRNDIKFILSKRSLNCGIMVTRRSAKVADFSNEYGLDFRKSAVEFVEGKKTLLISKSFFVRPDGKIFT